jgi:hypothetical protein
LAVLKEEHFPLEQSWCLRFYAWLVLKTEVERGARKARSRGPEGSRKGKEVSTFHLGGYVL